MHLEYFMIHFWIHLTGESHVINALFKNWQLVQQAHWSTKVCLYHITPYQFLPWTCAPTYSSNILVLVLCFDGCTQRMIQVYVSMLIPGLSDFQPWRCVETCRSVGVCTCTLVWWVVLTAKLATLCIFNAYLEYFVIHFWIHLIGWKSCD